jgi:hypothetical protein
MVTSFLIVCVPVNYEIAFLGEIGTLVTGGKVEK